MHKNNKNKSTSNGIITIALLLVFHLSFRQENEGFIAFSTKSGHEIKIETSGFNVRIADKNWNYTHPDFRKTVHELNLGWLSYFSGTMGDAFSRATGQYDLDYVMMFDHSEQYLKGFRFTEVKGPHRIIDLYHWYNNEKLHSSLGYITPLEMEVKLKGVVKKAALKNRF